MADVDWISILAPPSNKTHFGGKRVKNARSLSLPRRPFGLHIFALFPINHEIRFGSKEDGTLIIHQSNLAFIEIMRLLAWKSKTTRTYYSYLLYLTFYLAWDRVLACIGSFVISLLLELIQIFVRYLVSNRRMRLSRKTPLRVFFVCDYHRFRQVALIQRSSVSSFN